jgi:acetoin utilization deacetylase AcuC-like enzyme
MATKTGLVWHERYMWHDTGSGAGPLSAGGLVEPGEHVENPLPKRRFYNLLARTGVVDELVAIKPRFATKDELAAFHSRDYIDEVEQQSANNGGFAGFHVPFGPGSYDIARLAVGGCFAAVDAVVDEQVTNAYALVRPPGHHALAETGMGFCIFNNVALAARYALSRHGLERVAIVDWDVHHGNGTQAAFWEDDRVLTISIHQDRAFPQDCGTVKERGAGRGEGCNINIPLPPGCGTGAYTAAFERVVLPALHGYKPELILISSGLDASPQDPLGRMMLHSDGFRRLTGLLKGAAEELCDGRLVACHEGGYAAAYVPFCGLAIIEELMGSEPHGEDPSLALYKAQAGQDLQPHQDAAITEAAGWVRSRWDSGVAH